MRQPPRDEPIASLDAASQPRVVEPIPERWEAGAAILGIFHDQVVRAGAADRTVDVERYGASG